MWIFAPGGLLMPARIPEGGTEGTVDPKWLGPNADYTMQVRGRERSHLENVIRDYFEPLGLPYSEIQMTPEMDYNCRFYTTHEAMATVAYKQVMDIDFLKFKPQAENTDDKGKLLYKDGKEYHSVLNSIWSTVCRLGMPGGVWGTYSSTNPNGYKPGKTLVPLNQQGASGRTYGDALLDGNYADEFEDYPRGGFGARLHELEDYKDDDTNWWDSATFDDSDMDYTPGRTKYVEGIIESVEGIPEDQWEEHLPQHEFVLIEPFMQRNQSSPVEQFQSTFPTREEKKAARRAKSRRGKGGRKFYSKK